MSHPDDCTCPRCTITYSNTCQFCKTEPTTSDIVISDDNEPLAWIPACPTCAAKLTDGTPDERAETSLPVALDLLEYCDAYPDDERLTDNAKALRQGLVKSGYGAPDALPADFTAEAE